MDRSQATLLWRTFLMQFVASESIASDVQLRKSIIGIVAFLIPPGAFFMVSVFPAYEIVLAFFPDRIDETLTRLAFMFVTYSCVTVGLVTVLAWDSLSFDRRDAMVLGPLPITSPTIITAKLAALATFIVLTSFIVNAVSVLPFAIVTSNHFGFRTFLVHLIGLLSATLGGAVFVFATIVAIRGLVTLFRSPRLAAATGSLLQFLFVASLLCFSFVALTALSSTRPTILSVEWLPTTWFLAVFEHILDIIRPETVTYTRALIGLPVALVTAIVVSILAFPLQRRWALTPAAFRNDHSGAWMSRFFARSVAGGCTVTKAVSDFILLTIARNRRQQAPIAINAAIGTAIVVGVLWRADATDLSFFMRPRVAVLWMPLVLAFWTVVGVRASFFIPSELPASWSFKVNSPEPTHGYWAAVRASMMAFVIPPVLLLTGLTLGPLLGWGIVRWHLLLIAATLILLIEAVALTLNFVPFTRAYPPGHAKLKTRWPIYLLGMLLFAYVPTRLELWVAGDRTMLAILVAGIAFMAMILEGVGRRTAHKWSAQASDDPGDDPYTTAVLDLSG